MRLRFETDCLPSALPRGAVVFAGPRCRKDLDGDVPDAPPGVELGPAKNVRLGLPQPRRSVWPRRASDGGRCLLCHPPFPCQFPLVVD